MHSAVGRPCVGRAALGPVARQPRSRPAPWSVPLRTPLRALAGPEPAPARGPSAPRAMATGEPRQLLAAANPGGPPTEPAGAPVFDAAAADERRNRIQRRAADRRSQQVSYLVAAVAAASGVTALAVTATYLKFSWMLAPGSDTPYLDMAGTFLLAAGFVWGMEMWARWAHRALWHDSLWSIHASHHAPREGAFEANDLFAIINAGPAIALLAYGFFTPGLGPALCFGAGLGITIFGMAYMFVHDGLVHRRFPTGPIGQVPYLKRVAAAHALHHTERYGGVPWGLFLGPQELEAMGAGPELDRLVEEREGGEVEKRNREAAAADASTET